MTITEYEHGHLFRTELLSNVGSLGQIGHCLPELQQLPVHGEQTSNFVRAARDTALTKTQDLRNLTSQGLMITLTKFEDDPIKNVGGVRQSTRPGNGKNYIVQEIQINVLPVGFWILYRDTFL